MGILNFLLRRAKREATKMAVNAIVDEIANGSQKKAENVQQSAPASTAQSEQPKEAAPKADANEWDDEWDEEKKLEYIFEKEFPQYEVKKKVSPTTLGGTGKFLDYNFGVYENGVPKLFIMIVYNNTCCTRTYRWSKEEAERAGVPMINFVCGFRNEKNYIKDRLSQYI